MAYQIQKIELRYTPCCTVLQIYMPGTIRTPMKMALYVHGPGMFKCADFEFMIQDGFAGAKQWMTVSRAEAFPPVPGRGGQDGPKMRGFVDPLAVPCNPCGCQACCQRRPQQQQQQHVQVRLSSAPTSITKNGFQ